MNATTNRRLSLVAAGTLLTGTAAAATFTLLGTGAAGAAPARSLTPGQCTGPATVTMQLQRSDQGKLEAGFEVNHAKPGSVWRVRLTHNGAVYFTGRRTAGRDGSFSVDRVVPNRVGTDHFRGRATNVRSGQVCTVTASF